MKLMCVWTNPSSWFYCRSIAKISHVHNPCLTHGLAYHAFVWWRGETLCGLNIRPSDQGMKYRNRKSGMLTYAEDTPVQQLSMTSSKLKPRITGSFAFRRWVMIEMLLYSHILHHLKLKYMHSAINSSANSTDRFVDAKKFIMQKKKYSISLLHQRKNMTQNTLVYKHNITTGIVLSSL